MLIFLPFFSRELKHRLRCLIHNEEYSTNVSFHVTEGQSLKNEMGRINQEELRGVGALEFEPQRSQDLCLPMKPVLSSCSIPQASWRQISLDLGSPLCALGIILGIIHIVSGENENWRTEQC